MSNLSGFVKKLRNIMRNDAGINGDAQRIEQIAWILFLKVYAAKEQDWEWSDDEYTSIIPAECRWENWAADDKKRTAMTGDVLLHFVTQGYAAMLFRRNLWNRCQFVSQLLVYILLMHCQMLVRYTNEDKNQRPLPMYRQIN